MFKSKRKPKHVDQLHFFRASDILNNPDMVTQFDEMFIYVMDAGMGFRFDKLVKVTSLMAKHGYMPYLMDMDTSGIANTMIHIYRKVRKA